MGLGLGFGLENKDQKKIKGTTKPLMAILDIWNISCTGETGDGEMGKWGDGEMGRRRDGETGRRETGDGEMGKWGDGETGRRGDGKMGEMGRRGDGDHYISHIHAQYSLIHNSMHPDLHIHTVGPVLIA